MITSAIRSKRPNFLQKTDVLSFHPMLIDAAVNPDSQIFAISLFSFDTEAGWLLAFSTNAFVMRVTSTEGSDST